MGGEINAPHDAAREGQWSRRFDGVRSGVLFDITIIGQCFGFMKSNCLQKLRGRVVLRLAELGAGGWLVLFRVHCWRNIRDELHVSWNVKEVIFTDHSLHFKLIRESSSLSKLILNACLENSKITASIILTVS